MNKRELLKKRLLLEEKLNKILKELDDKRVIIGNKKNSR